VLDFKQADIWYASVQKCFGLPAGMAVMICSPACMAHVKSLNEKNHYNSLTFMAAMMDKWQTPYTPNVLGIYLLMRVLEKMKPIREVHAELVKRYLDWIEFFSDRKSLKHLIKNKAVHSFTVIPVETTVDTNQRIKSIAKKKGFLLGEGYGDLKPTTFRIANFPALKNSEIQSLKKILKANDL
jgi:phosphoserine aminotransferase